MKASESRSTRRETLRETYDEGYFHGANSGYPKEGYATHHPDWAPWLKRVKSLVNPADHWLDLGCAYGFLIEQARTEGFRVVGCDVSRFALKQNSAVTAFLAEADALALPFRSGSLRLITAFDVLEHLENPVQTIKEIHRCLSSDGLLIASTPDPCRFRGDEPTHVHESPPAHWLSLLEKNGFSCNFGFDGTDFNLILAASKSRSRVQHFHKLLFEDDFLRATQPFSDCVAWRVRAGFHTHPQGHVLGEKNEIYVLNSSELPISVELEFSVQTTGHNGAFLVVADGRVIERVDFLSTTPQFSRAAEKILFNSGGHSIEFQLSDGSSAGQVIIGPIQFAIAPATREELTATLPFDLFERYHASTLITQLLPLPPVTALDFGGYIGDQGGHWADASDFGLPAIFTDIRPADSRRYLSEAALPGTKFDLVLSLDVLEHIPKAARRSFLERLDDLSGRYILLAGPVASPDAEAAEKRVRESLRDAGAAIHGFLAEHREHGLPEREDITRWADEHRYSVVEIEGMSSHMWEVLQKVSLTLSYYQQYRTLEKLNRTVNARQLWASNGKPYRRFFLISKSAMPDQPFHLPRNDAPAELLHFLEQQPEILSRAGIQQQTDLLFLLNEGLRHQQLLDNQVRLLENHARELEKLLQAERQKPVSRIAWSRLRRRLDGKNE
jgi:SAM-dependent methyltransferase